MSEATHFVAISLDEIEEFKNSLYEFSTRIIEHQRFLEVNETPVDGIDVMFTPWRNVDVLKKEVNKLLGTVRDTKFIDKLVIGKVSDESRDEILKSFRD